MNLLKIGDKKKRAKKSDRFFTKIVKFLVYFCLRQCSLPPIYYQLTYILCHIFRKFRRDEKKQRNQSVEIYQYERAYVSLLRAFISILLRSQTHTHTKECPFVSLKACVFLSLSLSHFIFLALYLFYRQSSRTESTHLDKEKNTKKKQYISHLLCVFIRTFNRSLLIEYF